MRHDHHHQSTKGTLRRTFSRLGLVCTTALALTFTSSGAAQDHAELAIPADSATRQALKLDKADAGVVRVLKQQAPELHLDDGHASTVEKLLKGWRLYTRQECELVGQVTGGKPLYRGIYADMCRERRYAARIPVIIAVEECLSGELKKADDARLATECLEPLTPLKIDGDYDA